MRSLFVLVLLASLLSACSTGKKFTSRKYTSGRYVSHVTHKDRINKNTGDHEKITRAAALAKNNKSPEVEVAVAPKSVPTQENTSATSTSKKESAEMKLAHMIEKSTSVLEKSKVVQAIQRTVGKKPEDKKSTHAAAQPATKSLVSTILGGLGLLLEIVGFILTVSLEEYFFLTLCIVGLALGIVAMIMGFMGISQYKKDRRNGEKNVATLVLGIVGASTGLAAIIGAFYFSIFALIIVSSGGF